MTGADTVYPAQNLHRAESRSGKRQAALEVGAYARYRTDLHSASRVLCIASGLDKRTWRRLFSTGIPKASASNLRPTPELQKEERCHNFAGSRSCRIWQRLRSP